MLELEEKEDELKVCLRDLEQFESVRGEQAFEIFAKAGRLNDEIEQKMAAISLTNQADLRHLIDSFDQERAYLTLRDDFKLDIDMAKRKKRLKLDNFVGLDAYKQYLDSVWDTVVQKEEPQNRPNGDWIIGNALVFGPRGSGKVSCLFASLIERGLLEPPKPEPRVKAFFIDIKSVCERSDLNCDFFTRLLDSIQHCGHNLTLGLVLVVVKNLEVLFSEERHEPLRMRFLADLIYNMELNGPVRLYKLVFVVLSTEPWLLPLSFTHQFENVIECGYLSSTLVEKCVDFHFSRSLDALKTDWLCSELVEKFAQENQINEKLKSEMTTGLLLSPKLVFDAVQTSVNAIKGKIHEKFQQSLAEAELDADEYEELRLDFHNLEKRRLTLRKNSARYWKAVPSRLFSGAFTKGRLNSVNSDMKASSFKRVSVSSQLNSSLVAGQRKNSSVVTESQSTNQNPYECVKKELWRNESRSLVQHFESSLLKFLCDKSPVDQLVQNYARFKNRLEFADK